MRVLKKRINTWKSIKSYFDLSNKEKNCHEISSLEYLEDNS